MNINKGKIVLGWALASLLVSFTDAAMAQSSPAQGNLTISQQRQLESMIKDLVRDVIRENDLQVGSAENPQLKVTYDQIKHDVIIDFGRSAVPKRHTLTFDEHLQLIFQTVNDTVAPSVQVSGIKFLFGGVDIYTYFPEDRGPVENPGRKSKGVSPASAGNPVMLISAGHGYVLVNATNPATSYWAYQRPTVGNQIEDLQTIVLAAAVESSVAARSGSVSRYLARSTSNDAYTAACSGSPIVCPPFKNMAGRYYLESILPGNPEIWNNYSAQNLHSPKDHESDDIRSRGLYANHLQADQMITIHTNAASIDGAPQTTASGTRIYFNGAKTGADELATNVTCAMKEIINASAQYPSWVVTKQASTTGYGENNFANLPAIVIEVGFKDNVTDAAAMADPVFQGLMAKGVEKGARLSRGSEICKPFKLLSAANASGPHGTKPAVKISYEGFPQYPIKVHAHVASCPSGTCNDADFTINSPENGNTFSWKFGCNSSASRPSITYGVETTAVDADGVRVAAIASTVTCQKVTSM
ncbi:N-acetylmuramoyl-L-alanine amidase [Stenotrophomonas sp. NA06056]|uniref:N-acetylmuramoyl-L-alanine amidase n=1 Tax=Stenotrophomonas sp. NA06056 TaxID=2742129 RepID=UPI00158C51FE|nr:N-acetylmuramoyl-L-alanine amidase [Stenotrophomonas sp. NA06056]QKW55755.1 N-acetylmuramoyl-L-alanine amidase [Stenotrophomonas sp. NA06056]